jgi:hypothetical protein
MKITEHQLRRIVRSILFEFQSYKADQIANVDPGSVIDTALAGKHASGRPFPSWFNSLIFENKNAEDLDDFELLRCVEYLLKMNESGDIDPRLFKFYLDREKRKQLDSPYFEVLRSILLFTGSSVEAVRAPSKFKSSLSDEGEFPDRFFSPRKNDYVVAKKILTKLASVQNPSLSYPIYRGVSLLLSKTSNIKPGVVFNNKSISSWTTNEDMARQYALGNFSDQPDGDSARCVFKINNPKHGCPILDLSAYTSEDEVILGKKIKIIDIEIDTNNSDSEQDDFIGDVDVGEWPSTQKKTKKKTDPWDPKAKMFYESFETNAIITLTCEVIP